MSNDVEALTARVQELEEQLRALDEQLQVLRDIEDIKRLKARYLRFVDTQDWDAWKREVLTEDFRHESVGEVLEGHDVAVAAVAQSMSGGVATHQCHTPEIEITGPDTATGIWALQDVTRLPRDGSGLIFRGDGYYYEDYVRTDAGWRLRSNSVEFLVVDGVGLPEGARDGVR